MQTATPTPTLRETHLARGAAAAASGTASLCGPIESYLPMVRRVALKMLGRLPPNVQLDDLIQAGSIGLMDAMQRYEAGHGAQFETFAMQRVRGAMLDELRASDWVPRSVRKSQRDIGSAIQQLEHELQRAPTGQEVAAHMALSLQGYHEILADVRGAQLVYSDDYDSEDGAFSYLDSHTQADKTADPAAKLADRRFREALVAAITNLPERQQFVMSMYYEHDMNLREIAAALCLTESRVCQIHGQTIVQLRALTNP
ncbi:MAG: RNA polymerase sigma factor FliA [Bdellovibrionales bacterium]|nr:RNA polymerase sigma factor FliA [Ramlibacter sp.]